MTPDELLKSLGATAPSADSNGADKLLESLGAKPTKADLLSTKLSALTGDAVSAAAPVLSDFVKDTANVVGSAAIGAPLELANQVGNIGNFIGLDNPLPELVDQSKQILLDNGFSPAGLNAGAVGMQGVEAGAIGGGAFALAGFGAKALVNLPKLTQLGLDSNIVGKAAGILPRFIARALQDATVTPLNQIAGQAKALGAASAASSGIEDDTARGAAELLGTMSFLGLANAGRIAFTENTASKSQLGTLINMQSRPIERDFLDGELPTLASVTNNPSIKASENMFRTRSAESDQLFREIEDANLAVAKKYAKDSVGVKELDRAELQAIQADQLQTVQSQVDTIVERTRSLQNAANPLEAGVETDVALGKVLDSANASVSRLYDDIGNSTIKAMTLLPAVKDALNIGDLPIKASAIYPKISTILKGIKDGITNQRSDKAELQKSLIAQLKVARKNNDFNAATDISKALKKTNSKSSDATPAGELSINQVQGARSLLLQGIREAIATESPDLARRYSIVLDKLEDSLTAAEKQGNVDVVKLRNANSQYRQIKNIFGLGEISKSLQSNKAGGNRFSLETLGQRFIKTGIQNGEETAQQVVNAVRRYDKAGVSFEDLQGLMRKQFSAMIATRASNSQSGTITEGTLKQFISNHSSALEIYGIKNDFSSVVKATATADRALQSLGKDRSMFENKTYIARILDTDNPYSLVTTAIKNKNVAKMVTEMPNGANKDAVRGYIMSVSAGDLENAFSGNSLQQAIANKDIQEALGKDMFIRMNNLAKAVARHNTQGGGTPILESRRALPVMTKQIERLGKRFFSVIRSAQNKIGITAFESALNNSTIRSHDILFYALKDGRNADMLAKFATDNPAAYSLMLKQAFANTALLEQGSQQ